MVILTLIVYIANVIDKFSDLFEMNSIFGMFMESYFRSLAIQFWSAKGLHTNIARDLKKTKN